VPPILISNESKCYILSKSELLDSEMVVFSKVGRMRA